MISKVIFLGHSVKMKYSYQKWMERVRNRDWMAEIETIGQQQKMLLIKWI